jgi:hypothetical protein
MVIGDTNGGELVDGSVYICRDTIITFDAVNRDKAVSVEYYCVLGLYNKHYNKWYMEVADKVLWDHNKPKEMKAWRIMASMVRKIGTEDFEDVQPDVSLTWSHSAVYCTKNLDEVISVIGSVVDEK